MVAKLNITVVEDHDALRAVTLEALQQQGNNVLGISSAEAMDDEAAGFPADLFIIDVNLPGEDGMSLASRIRAGNPRAGIIMTTGRTMIKDRIAGYDSGADVYLCKPVALEELMAAVTAVGRRVDFWHARTRLENKDGFLLDAGAMTLSGPEGRVGASVSDIHILTAFASSASRQLEYWQLMELLGQTPDDFKKANLEVKIVRLRKKLQLVGAELGCIRSVRLVGYQLCLPIQIT
jgi:DNA-binding response OmpR family regulator